MNKLYRLISLMICACIICTGIIGDLPVAFAMEEVLQTEIVAIEPVPDEASQEPVEVEDPPEMDDEVKVGTAETTYEESKPEREETSEPVLSVPQEPAVISFTSEVEESPASVEFGSEASVVNFSASEPEESAVEPPVSESEGMPALIESESEELAVGSPASEPEETPAPVPVESESEDPAVEFPVSEPEETPAPVPVESESEDPAVEFPVSEPEETPAPVPVESESEDPAVEFSVSEPEETSVPIESESEDPAVDSPASEPEETSVPIVSRPTEPVIDYSEPVSKNLTFDFGYAELLKDAKLYEEYDLGAEVLATVEEEGILFISDREKRSGFDRVEVWFTYEDVVCCGWVDADALRPMSEDEVDDFQLGVKSNETLYYDDDTDYPLSEPVVHLVIVEQTQPTPTPSESENPESVTSNDDNVESTPVEGENAESTPIEGENVESVPSDDDNVESTPVEDENAESTPVEGENVESIPSDDDNVESTPVEGENAESTPVEGENVESIPSDDNVESTPVEDENAESTPIEGENVESIPSDDDNVESTPVEGENAESTPVEGENLESIPSDDNVESTPVEGENAESTPVEGENAEFNPVESGDIPSLMQSGPVLSTSNVVPVETPSIEIRLGAAQLNAIPRSTFQLPVTFVDASGNICEVEAVYTSSNPAAATVDAQGNVKAIAAGTTTIEIATPEGVTASCVICVYPEPYQVLVNASTLQVGVEDTVQLLARYDFSGGAQIYSGALDNLGVGTFTSADAGIAKVDINGNILGVRPGTTTITFQTYNNAWATCTVTVIPAPQHIHLDKVEMKLGVGMTDTLTATFDEGSLGTATFTSSDPSVATVSADGVVTAIAAGTANIIVRSQNGLQEFCALTVVDAPDQIVFESSAINLIVDRICEIPAVFTRPDGKDCMTVAQYGTSNARIVAVNQDGYMMGVKSGSATITVSTSNGLKAELLVVVRNVPTKVELSATTMEIGVGQSSQLLAAYIFRDGERVFDSLLDSVGVGAFETSDPTVATVDENGLITGQGIGQAQITFRTYNNKYKSCTVQVFDEPTSIHLNLREVKLGVAMTEKLSVSYNEGEMGAATFTSSDENIAIVAQDGTITAVAEGIATITATSQNGKTDSCVITIVSAPEQIAFESSAINMIVNRSCEIPVIIQGKDGGECMAQLSYATSNSRYVSVSQDGYMKAVAAGNATITVTAQNGVSAELLVVVRKSPTKVELSANTLQVGEGSTTQILAAYYYSGGNRVYSAILDELGVGTFLSADPSIATIDENGIITGVKKGTTQVSFVTYNGKLASCTVSVLAVPTVVYLDKTEVKLAAQMTTKLTPSFGDLELGTVNYSSSDEGVATVASDGTITAVSRGTATITATVSTATNVYAYCKVEVVDAPDQLLFDVSAINMIVGQTCEIPVKMARADGQPCEAQLTYETSNSRYVAVNQEGYMKAAAAGNATITVTTHNGVTAQLLVVVRKSPTKVVLDASSLQVGEKSTVQLGATYYYSGGNRVYNAALDNLGVGTFTSADPSIATVDENGVITGVSKGTTKVSFTTYNGKSASCTITVLAVPTVVYLDKTEIKLAEQMTAKLTPSFGELELGTVVYTSSDERVATVASDGTVTATGRGTATITATVLNAINVQATCKVDVVDAPDQLLFDVAAINLIVGQICEIPVKMARADGQPCEAQLTYETSNSRYVVVNQDGYMKGARAGNATITVTAHNGATAQLLVVVRKEPTKVQLSASALEVGEGSTAQLLAAYYYSGGNRVYDAALDNLGVGTFTSADPSIATIDENGIITGHQKGTTRVSFTTYNGKSASCTVTVLAKPTSIRLEENSVKLGVGMTSTLKVLFNEYEMGTVAFSSDNPAVATVASDGTITATGKGKATILASVENASNVQAYCVVEVIDAPDQLLFDVAAINLIVNHVCEIPVEMVRADGEPCMAQLTYETSNSRYVVVNQDGYMKGARAGNATITVTAHNGVSAQLLVVVRNTPTKVVLSANTLQLGEGQTSLLQARYYYSGGDRVYDASLDNLGVGEFTSSDPNVASVDELGNITALKKGTTRITFNTYNGKSAYCTVTVVAPPSYVHLNKTQTTLSVGMKETLIPSYGALELGTTTFSSNDTSVVTVTPEGEMTAVGMGSTTIVGVTQNGKHAECLVTVIEQPDTIELTPNAINLIPNRICEIPKPTLIQNDGKECMTQFTYSTSNSKIVQVNQDGYMMGGNAGNAYVTITAHNGLSATLLVVVRKSPTKVELNASTVQVGEGQSSQILAKYYYSGGNRVYDASIDSLGVGMFTSSNPDVVAIDQNGNITGLKKGVSTITFRTYNDKYASCTVMVVAAPSVVYLDKTELKLGVGMTDVLTASYGAFELGTTTFTSNNPSVATVTESGKVTAVAAGTAIITAETHNGKTARCEVHVIEAPESLSIESAAINLIRGGSCKIPVTFSRTDGKESIAPLSYHTSNSSIAYVANDGTITGVRSGSATITISTPDGLRVSCLVVVRNVVTDVKLSASTMQLGTGQSTTLQAAYYFDGGSRVYDAKLDKLGVGTFMSSNPNIVSIDENGNLTGLQRGEALISFRTYNGVVAYCMMTVLDAPSAIYLDKYHMDMGVGMQETLVASYKEYEMGTTTFTSEDPTVAAVTPEGVVTAVGVGETTIWGETQNGQKAKCTVKVVSAPDMIALESSQVNLIVGRSCSIPVRVFADSGEDCLASLTYATTASNIVSVTTDGVITGVKSGTARITVMTQNGKSAICTVNVYNVPTYINLSAAELQVGVGQAQKLEAVYLFNGGVIKYNSLYDKLGVGYFESANPDIAMVDDYGNIIGIQKGSTEVTFHIYDGVSATCMVNVLAAPSLVTLNKTETTLGIGMEETLIASYLDEFELGTTTFISDNEAVASVTPEGTIKAVSVGTATITGTTQNGLTAQCNVTVIPAPDSISLDFTACNLIAGQTLTLKPSYSYQGTDNCMATLTYASNAPSIATVNEHGLVTGIKAGTAIIRTMTHTGIYVDCYVYVRPVPKGVKLSHTSGYLGEGQTYTLSATISTSSGSFTYTAADQAIATYSSLNPEIATVDQNGTIKALAVGTAVIRLTTYNGYSANCTVQVSEGTQWLRFSKTELTLNMGEKEVLSCDKSASSLTNRTYTSSDESVVKVVGNEETCTVQAVAPGKATITATSSNGRTATCEVTVMATPEQVVFDQASITIGIGETARLPQARVISSLGECAQQVTYSTASNAIQMADDGTVTGMLAGTATIVATAYNGVTGTCVVTILDEPTTVSLNITESRIAVGSTAQLTVILDTAGSYTFSVDDSSIASVSANGLVTAHKVGTATITVKTYNGLESTLEVEVLAVPTDISLSADALKLGVGQTDVLTATIPEDSVGKIAFTSNNASVVTVAADGTVTAKAPGTARITAYVVGHAGVFDVCEVTVLPLPTSIKLQQETLMMKTGASETLNIELISDASEYYGECVFTSATPEIAQVDADGRITAVAEGETEIIVSLKGFESIQVKCTVIVVDAQVRIDVTELSLGLGETRMLGIDLPYGKNGFAVESSNASIVSISEAGLISANAKGDATLTISNGGESVTCLVHVVDKPTSVQLSGVPEMLTIGDSIVLNPTIPEDSASAFSYSSSDSSVLTVDASGTVTAVGYGQAAIKVSTYDAHVSASCNISVVYAPETVRFAEGEEIVLSALDSYVLKAPVMFHHSGMASAGYTLAISDGNYASVSREGDSYVLRGLREGEAVLRLETDNGLTAKLTVKVVAAPMTIAFAENARMLGVGETFKPTVLGDNGASIDVSLTSSNEDVLRVDASGKLYAVSQGTAEITASARSFSGLQVSVEIEVVEAPRRIQLNASEVTLGIGEGFQLAAIFESGATSASVTFHSDNELAVYVDTTGYVRAVGTGSANITATTYNGQTARCIVHAKAAPTALSIGPESMAVCVADVIQLIPIFGSADEFGSVLYESSNLEVALVDESGLVTFLETGKAVIQAKTYNGYTADVTIEVSQTPAAADLGYDTAVILLNDTAQMNVQFDVGTAYYTLTCSDPSIIELGTNGEIRALALGKATIVLDVPALNLKDTCEIEVVTALEGVEITPVNDTLKLNEQTEIAVKLLPENAIGTGLLSFACDNTSVAVVDAATGIITGEAYGSANITATTGDGKTGSCVINVLGGKRRMLISYNFGEVGDEGYLPFAYNNAYSMYEAFSRSVVEGQSYSFAGPLSNPTKSSLLGTINSFFADATDDDVSVIYLLAHGGPYALTGSYGFGFVGMEEADFSSDYCVTAGELISCVEKIKGKVIIIMDSCHSGGLIDATRSRLDAAGGRISVLASAHFSTVSSYWNVTNRYQAVDFYTFALLHGLGYNESDGLGGQSRGWYSSTEPADANGDGAVTVSEFFSYGRSMTVDLVNGQSGNANFHGTKAQVPQSYIGSATADLVLFER